MNKERRVTQYRRELGVSGKPDSYEVTLGWEYSGFMMGKCGRTVHRIKVYDFWQIKEIAKNWETGEYDWKEVKL